MTFDRSQNARRGGIPRGVATTGPAVLSYGFRPFFLGAGLWAITAMGVWIGALIFGWTPGGDYGPVNWHAHEMLFGYTSAALAGFMLTAIPNWTGRLPVSGLPLALLVVLWLSGRLAMLVAGQTGILPAIVADVLFLPALGLIAAREITAGHNWRNLHVVIGISLLTLANIWFHFTALGPGDTGMAHRLGVSVWVMLITVIGGRIAVSFTRNWLSRHKSTVFPASIGQFDRISLVAALFAFALWIFWPYAVLTGAACLVAATLHLVRLARWRGWLAWREPLVLVLHTSYLFIPLGQFAIGAASFGLIGMTSALHVLTVGAIGNMTLAVMSRATRGHTGRQLTASATTTVAYAAMAVSALSRPLVDFVPQAYHLILDISGTCWLLAFMFFVAEYAPMLLTRHRRA